MYFASIYYRVTCYDPKQCDVLTRRKRTEPYYLLQTAHKTFCRRERIRLCWAWHAKVGPTLLVPDHSERAHVNFFDQLASKENELSCMRFFNSQRVSRPNVTSFPSVHGFLRKTEFWISQQVVVKLFEQTSTVYTKILGHLVKRWPSYSRSMRV